MDLELCESHREWHIKTTIRELAIYLMFICLIVFRELINQVDKFFYFSVCFGPTSSNRFLYKDLLSKHLEDVEKVEQVKIP